MGDQVLRFYRRTESDVLRIQKQTNSAQSMQKEERPAGIKPGKGLSSIFRF
jgi:hypothetical protein